MRLRSLLTAVLLCAVPAAAKAQMQGSTNPPTYHPAPPFAVGLGPEDIVALPGTKWLIAGAAPGSTPADRAGLSLIDTTNPATILPLYPAPNASDDFDAGRFKDCPGPLKAGFAPHGINVTKLMDGSYDLLVINHRGRESVEIFHLTQDATPRAVWRGCVVLPKWAGGNSLTALPNQAGYVVTNFIRRGNPDFLDDMERGTETGDVLKWTPAGGWSEIVPQKFSGANGVEISPDGHWLFINEWSDYKVWRFPMDGNGPPKVIHLDFMPDNLRLSGRGTLLIAGQDADAINVMTCLRRHVPCQPGFTVLEMNPDTMQTTVLAKGGDADFGGATGSALAGGYLWISAYYGNKVARYAPNAR